MRRVIDKLKQNGKFCPITSLFLSPRGFLWRILRRRGCLWMPLFVGVYGSTSDVGIILSISRCRVRVARIVLVVFWCGVVIGVGIGSMFPSSSCAGAGSVCRRIQTIDGGNSWGEWWRIVVSKLPVLRHLALVDPGREPAWVFCHSLHECPLILLSILRSKKVSKDMLDSPVFNLNTSSRSALLHCSSNDHSPSLCSLSW